MFNARSWPGCLGYKLMFNSIPEALNQSAKTRPNHAALRFGCDQLTYGQLLTRCNRLARVLIDQGVQRGDRVGIYLDRGLDSIVALYAIMMAGAVYVPLDPQAPIKRLTCVTLNADIRYLVSEANKAVRILDLAKQLTQLECVIGLPEPVDNQLHWISWAQVEAVSAQSLTEPQLNLDDHAYIIYTSGSTGEPKGILHTHGSCLSFVMWAVRTYDVKSDDVFTNQASLHFDMSIFDLLPAITVGATVVIVPYAVTKLPVSYAEFLARERISIFFTIPFILKQLLHRGMIQDQDLSSLRWVIFGGDIHSPKDILGLIYKLPAARFSHMYGPAETNGCTYYHIDNPVSDTADPFPIGKPCEQMDILIIDIDDKCVTEVSGELLVAGPSRMQGYWQRPELNERALVVRSDAKGRERTFYRTGDLVERMSDGNLRFVGRKDRQIKLRGYRIELDEVEMTLLSHQHVDEVAVVILQIDNEPDLLFAAISLHQKASTDTTTLINFLREHLPHYAIPEKIEFVDSFPRTSTGKISRRHLCSEYASVRR